MADPMTDTPHLHALAMRARAAIEVTHWGEYNIAAMVRTLPLESDHAALLAEAVKLPEIAGLVAFATHVSDGDGADYTDNWKLAEAALQPFLALETP